MPSTPQAALFVFSELWTVPQLENYVCSFGPEGMTLDFLQNLLGLPSHGAVIYLEHLLDIALRLFLAGHQRTLGQVLQETGFLPFHGPLPAIQVLRLFLPFYQSGFVLINSL
jgi:hypothetical protein